MIDYNYGTAMNKLIDYYEEMLELIIQARLAFDRIDEWKQTLYTVINPDQTKTAYDEWLVEPDNKELQQQVKEEWMMYYSVKHGGKEGRIKAYNRASAEIQFQWLSENKDCFCRTCTHQYLKDYVVYMDSYNTQCVHKEPQVISGIMQG